MAKPNVVNAVRIILFLVIVALVLVAIFTNPDFVSFGAYDAGECLQMITPLILVSLFIERTLEVLLSAWRGTEKARLKLEVIRAGQGADDGERSSLRSNEEKFLAHKIETRKIASAGGVALGIVVSALGIHALEMFVDADSYYQLSGFQLIAFRGVDIVVTGALIGGGAEALHRIIASLIAFMDSAKRKAEGIRVS